MKRQIVFLHDQQDKVVTMLPKGFASIFATTPETLLEKVNQYQPDVCIILPSLLDGEPWKWLEQIKVETMFVRCTTEEEYHFFNNLQKWFPAVVAIPHMFAEDEIRAFLSHLAFDQTIQERESIIPPKTRAFVGSGGTGITTFLLLAAPWYAQQHPHKKLLLVDMNMDKRDLSVALSAQPAQLSLWQSYLARGNDQFVPFGVKHPLATNISVISAVKSWEAQEVSTFLSVVRREYDEVWFDLSRPFHVPRLMEDVDDVTYVVRPDGLCLTAMKRIVRPEWTQKAKLLVNQLDERYANTSEISTYLDIKEVMGTIPFEYPLLPLDLTREVSLSKKMRKALEKLDWGLSELEGGKTSRLQKWMLGWKK
ncbi:hypothetical protein [Brevibacillus choshinensis]|uniref:hypothetical protein n=1 Tax=Brevibacillus choshinensis TaxID=54911 RepID=UPI002E1E922B|nr:hypothetical protein [Brevibacillus choshinensis]